MLIVELPSSNHPETYCIRQPSHASVFTTHHATHKKKIHQKNVETVSRADYLVLTRCWRGSLSHSRAGCVSIKCRRSLMCGDGRWNLFMDVLEISSDAFPTRISKRFRILPCFCSLLAITCRTPRDARNRSRGERWFPLVDAMSWWWGWW